MNLTEQRIQRAAPADLPAAAPFPLAGPGQRPEDSEQLVPGNGAMLRAVRARLGVPPGRHRWGRALNPVILLMVVAAIGVALFLPFVPQAGEKSASRKMITAVPYEAAEWRTVEVTRPWAAGPQLSARFDVPEDWQVRRQRVSADFPGLHATVRDGGGLAVAMLYLGPAPAGALARTCTAGPAGSLEMDRKEMTTGAEALGTALRAAYSYSLVPGTETRGTFGLVPVSADGSPCAVSQTVVAEGRLILQFSDALHVPVTGDPHVPRSGYGRTFAAGDDARGYLASGEYVALRRMVTSLRVEIPADVSALWNLAPDAQQGRGTD